MEDYFKVYREKHPRLFASMVWLGFVGLFYIIGHFIPEGYDWAVDFSHGYFPSFWTPWSPVVFKLLNWPFVFAVTIFTVTYRTYHYNHSPLPIALAIVSLPTIWVLFLSNLDGLALAGLLLLPWGVPLATMKPHLAAFALLANKKSFIAGAIWGLISLAIWGLWPLNFSTILSPEWRINWPSDITLFPWGALIALPLLWFSRGDEDLLMAAGSFVTPHLFPYHFILLMPALARMKPAWMVATWLISWTPLISNWVGPIGWHMGNVLGGCLWLGIYLNKKKSATMQAAENSKPFSQIPLEQP